MFGHGKSAVALSSVAAAVVLTTLKLGAGLASGSLGVLAEAAHSGLDLVAALTTFFAIRIAAREPDESHPYGHGRVENVAALFETLLLLLTGIWVIWEGVDRLMVGGRHVEVSVWAVGVMVISIAVDWSRSRALRRAAREHESQALEADALHFSTDLWSSAVVLAGLALVWLGDRIGLHALAQADAGAAIVVALIVVWVSGRLGVRTVAALVDTAPPGLADEMRALAAADVGVLAVDRVRLRQSGDKLFVDLVVRVPRMTSFAAAHAVADRIEAQLRIRAPRADVVVHAEPAASDVETAAEQVQFVARQRGVDVHDVRVRQVGDGLEVDLHVELDPRLPLVEAHAVASSLEAELMDGDRRLSAVNTHLEAPGLRISRDEEVTEARPELVADVRSIADQVAGPATTHEVRIYRSGEALNLVLHASFRPDQRIDRVHEVSAEIERALRARLPGIGTVLVHAEPMTR